MCGIAGCWEFEQRRDGIAAMTTALAHRGPDGEGLWLDAQAGLALGHRRLAIVGGSLEGQQPMRTADGRYVFLVNGELYNYIELRKDLEREGCRLHGNCDSEVMLQALAHWGLDRALSRFNGMFAFALWDTAERTLHLVRDRIGEKPLYYGWWRNAFVFASELKALRTHPGFDSAVDTDALARYFRYSYIGGEHSIYRDVRKLPPGTRLTVKGPNAHAKPVPYWSLAELAQDAAANPFTGTAEEAVARLDTLLDQAVRLRMRADVPVGAFLSGGMDSSTIVSMMARANGQPVKTFSIGTRDSGLDEAPLARAIAKHLHCDHTELYIEDAEARALIPQLPAVYDEPFADASAIPSLCVARLACQSVKTTIAGDGGDEFLAGYTRYAKAARLWRQTRWMPAPVRIALGRTLQQAGTTERMQSVGKLLSNGYPRSIHWHLLSHWKDPGPLTKDLSASWSRSDENTAAGACAHTHFPLEVLHLDAVTLLPGDLLVKVDRASMSHGLEVRLPFLDTSIIDFCLRLPTGLRTRPGQSKWVLRQVLGKYLPDSLIAVKKKGFAVPLAQWLRGPLRDWSEELLSERRLRQSGVLEAKPIRRRWQAHCSGQQDYSRALWNVLMYQAWDESRRKS